MLLKNYYISITFRIILITLTCYAFAAMLQKLHEEYYYTIAGIAFLLILQVVLLISYINKINRDLRWFFNAIHNQDSSLIFPEDYQQKSVKELYHSMNNVNNLIQEIKIDNERKSLYLKNIIDHIDIGILAFDQDGKIELANKAAMRIIGIHTIGNISKLKRVNTDFATVVESIKPSENKVLRISIDNNQYDLSIKANIYKFKDQKIKLVSFQNIHAELERRELESWQKLIRILNHEIMNSLSPVISLTKTMIKYFRKKNNTIVTEQEIKQKTINNTLNGLHTIEETSIGLMEFINNYRSITSIPKPQFKKVPVAELFHNILTLLANELELSKVIVKTKLFPKDLEIIADSKQISQVIINLIYNSIEALKKTNTPEIELTAFKDDTGRIKIEVSDNGPGIPPEIIDDIFVPFFTTKENGSGIGLSFSRQIIRLHNGRLSVRSEPNKETVFSLVI
jgi:two-component system nitrogen regulation sensor histidine kinase NtrY